MTLGQKYHLLKHHFVPSIDHTFLRNTWEDVSERCGIQAEVQRDAPLAIYTHCAWHRLNLVTSHSCSVSRNTLYD